MKYEKVILVAILVLAAGLRLWRLDSMPPGLYHDEAYNGLDALALVQGREFPIFHEAWELYANEAHPTPPEKVRWPIFFEGNFGREPVHVYLMAASVGLFGNTVFALRLVPAVAGIMAVWLTWLVAKALADEGDWVMPLAAAFVLATLFPAVHFSRFAIRAMVFVPVELGAVWLFLRGWRGEEDEPLRRGGRRGSLSSFWLVGAGCLVGVGLYVYAAGRLFPLVLGGVFLGRMVLPQRRGEGRSKKIIQFGWLVLAAVVVSVPLLVYFYENPYFFVARSAYVATHGKGVEQQLWLTWVLNVGRTVRGLFWLGETHLRHNLVGRPYMDVIQAVFFVVGMIKVFTAEARRGERKVLLGIWLGVMLLPTVLSGDAPHFGRMTGAAPVVAILVGFGVAWVWGEKSEPLRRGGRRGARRFLRMIVLGLGVVSLGWTVRHYFWVYGGDPALQTGAYGTADGFYLPDWELGVWIAGLGEGTAVYLTPTQQDMATILFALGDGQDRLRSYDGTAGTLPLGVPGRDVVYAVRPDAVTTIDTIRAQWDGRVIEEERETVTLLTVDGGVSAERLADGGARPFENGIVLVDFVVEQNVTENVTSDVTVTFLAERPSAVPLTAFVHGLAADGALVSQDDHPPRGYPTTEWRPGEWITERFTLPAGERPIDKFRIGWYQSETLLPEGNALEWE